MSELPWRRSGGPGPTFLGPVEGRKKKNNCAHLYLLRPPLVCSLVLVIDAAKVGHDDRDRQGNYQHTTQRADGTKDLPCNRLRNHVSVTAKGDRKTERINLVNLLMHLIKSVCGNSIS